MNKNQLNNDFLKYSFLLGLIFISCIAHAQITISGNVTSDTGAPLPGVNITVKGFNKGTVSDFDGNYTLENVNTTDTLVFSYVGFFTQEIPVEGETTINVTLESDMNSLDQVVVVGYGTVKKSDLTGAVSSIKAEDFNPGANASIDQALQGRVAGVQIFQKSNEPGGGLSINIRGAGSIQGGNEPLYVIDGVIVNNGSVAGSGGVGFTANQNPRNPLNAINPADIESIEVLKDASSTAIYGSRGSNGVVIITTKKGKQGKLRISYDGYSGFQEVAETLDLLSPTEYRDVLNSLIDAGAGDAAQYVSEIQENGTDWQDEVLRSMAPVQNHNFSFSGGGEKNTYFASLNYFNQEGLVEGSGMQRYNARVNLNYNDPGKLKMGINMNNAFIADDYASTGLGVNTNAGALNAAINYDPTILPYDEEGNFVRSDLINMENPLAILDGEKAKGENFRFIGNVFLEYFVIPNELSTKLQIAGDLQNQRREIFVQPDVLSGLGTGGIASIQTGRKDYVSVEGSLNYNKAIGDDNLTATAVASYEYYQTKSFGGNGRGYALPDLGANAIGSGDPTLNNIGSGRTGARFISYLGRLNYSLNNKYLLTASLRADGSSRFGKNNRFGYFPSAAIGWKLHQESFLEDADWLNELKLRVSGGQTGNANIGNSLAYQTFSAGGDLLFGDQFYNTITPTRIANPDLTWERAVQYDVGIDFGFLKNRISGSVDYFRKETKDLLVGIPQPPNTGYSVQTQNLGGILNKGFELTLNATPVKSGKFRWDVTATMATLDNEVLDIGNRGDIIRGAVAQIPDFALITPGTAMDSYYGYIVDGVWQLDDDFSITDGGVNPGDLKFRDLNGDGTINADDRTVIGSPIPDFTWGFVSNFQYDNITLDLVFQGVEGIEKLNGNLVNTYFPNDFRRNRIAEPLLNRWTPENPTNEYPSFIAATPQSGNNGLINTRTVEDASYIRLQSIRLGYNFPLKNIDFLSKLSLYAIAQNVFTITDYSGPDPAANASGSNTINIDYNAYPLPRTYLFGMNVQF